MEVERLTSTPAVLAGCLRRTGRTVPLPVRAGNHRAEVGQNCRLLLVGHSSDHILLLAEGGIGRAAADHRSLDMAVVVVGRIGRLVVDSPVGEDSRLAEAGSLGRSRVADSLDCSLVGRIDRMELT